MDSNTARQQVLNILGDKEGSAGKAVTDFVDEAMRENHKSIEALAQVYKDLNQEVESMKTTVANKSDLNDVYGCLRAVAGALNGAIAAHDAAARPADTNSASAREGARQAQVATSQADAAVSEAKLTLESLHERLENIENWRKDTVDPTLERHGNMLDEHERWINEQRRRQGHDEHEHEHEHAEEHPHTQALPVVGPHPRSHEAVYTRRRYNPIHWNWIQWVLALALGLALAATLGTWLHDLTTPYLQWWSWLWWLVTFLIGFFGGGLLGSIWDTREQEYDEHTVVRREREYDDHTAVRLRA